MSTARAESHGVPVARMEAFIEELRLVKAGIADMQGRLDNILNELAAEIQPVPDIRTEEAPEADRPAPAEIAVEAEAVGEPAPLAAAPISGDQLTLIRGIDEAAVAALRDRDIIAFAGIAALSADDVAALGETLGDARRISKECWIEQAALLADGIATAHARTIESAADAAVDAQAEIIVPAEATADTAPAETVEAAPVEQANVAMLIPQVAEMPAVETPAVEIVAAAEPVPSPAEKSGDASTSLVPVSSNVIVLAERRSRPIRTARSAIVRAGRWAAVIALIAMAVAIAAAGTGLASGQGELLPLKRGCAYLLDICSLLPGIQF